MLGIGAVHQVTPAYLFGGDTSFKARRDFYTKVTELLSSTGVVSSDGPALPQLEPEYTQALAELAVRFVERPTCAVRVPLVLQDVLWRALGAQGAPIREDKNSLAAEKLAQDLLDFLKVTSRASWRPTV